VCVMAGGACSGSPLPSRSRPSLLVFSTTGLNSVENIVIPCNGEQHGEGGGATAVLF